MTLIGQLKQFIYKNFAIGRNVQVDKSAHIGPLSIVSAPQGLSIGPDVYIGKYCTIQVDGAIGRGSLIGNSVGIVGRTDHDYKQLGRPIRWATWVGDRDGSRLSSVCEIAEDVWIGYGAVILAPVKIGRGSIVAAGSVVTRDVAPYSIVAGNPATAIGQRFESADVKSHETGIESFYSREGTIGGG